MASYVLTRMKFKVNGNCHLWKMWRFLLPSCYSSWEHLSKYSYWKSRYQKQSADLSFDWFLRSEDILDFLIHSMGQCHHDKSKPLSYLDLGCGTSSLAGNILTNSPTPVLLVLLDFVSEALHYQKQYISTCTALIPESSCQLICADVMFLPFGDGCFNIAVDKGTMDALLKDKVNGHSKAQVMMSEVRRVLAPVGRFLQISDEDPDTRLLFLEQLNKVNSSHVLTEQTTLDAQLLGDNCESFVGSTHCQTARTLPVSKQLSSWSFKVIPTSWNKEYFILWSDNHH